MDVVVLRCKRVFAQDFNRIEMAATTYDVVCKTSKLFFLMLQLLSIVCIERNIGFVMCML